MIIGILSTLVTFTYSQLDCLITYILCMIYMVIRTMYWIEQRFRHIKFNIYFSLTFAVLYLFSRAYHQRERENFCKMKNQKQLLSLFHNLIKLYHDGIVISTNDNIVLYNKQTAQIFRVNQEQIFNEQYSLRKPTHAAVFHQSEQVESITKRGAHMNSLSNNKIYKNPSNSR